MKKVTLLHTVKSVYSTFSDDLKKACPEEIEVDSLVDEYLVTNAKKCGYFPENNMKKLRLDLQSATLEYPDLIINQTNYSVIYMGKNVDMPPKELELLYFLASSPNHVFTREQLLDQIWGYEYIGDTRTVDVHIKRLREKIKDHASWKISTIWGIGYKFEVRS